MKIIIWISAVLIASLSLTVGSSPIFAAGNFAFEVVAEDGLVLEFSGFAKDGTERFRVPASPVSEKTDGKLYRALVDETIVRGQEIAKWCIEDASGKWSELPDPGITTGLCDTRPSETEGTYTFEPRSYVIEKLQLSEIVRKGYLADVGEGVTKDAAIASRWYTSAAELGSAEAQRNLGGFYGSGHGVEEDQKEAARLFLLAAQQGDSQAQYVVGRWYSDSESEKIVWLKKAASQGQQEATQLLSEMGVSSSVDEITATVSGSPPENTNPTIDGSEPEIPALPMMLASDKKASLRCVQSLLNALGFEAGPSDGVMGSKTRNAAAQYISSGDADEEYPDLTTENSFEWCDTLVSEFEVLRPIAVAEFGRMVFSNDATILISESRPQDTLYRLSGADAGVLYGEILDIGERDVGFWTLQTETSPQGYSVIYILNQQNLTGSNVTTSWTFNGLNNDRVFTEKYEYPIDGKTPIEPLIIVNGSFALDGAHNDGEFLYELFVDGDKIAERLVKVK